jgi:hypothetical protein
MPAAKSKNPFTVQTPEDMSAEDAVSIFVDVFTDFYKIPMEGHTFLHGPRGSGKSMMFRYLQPDCQCLAHGRSIESLDFFAAYVPIKNTDLKLTELLRLQDENANIVLNEHFMVMFVAVKVFAGLAKLSVLDKSPSAPQNLQGFAQDFVKLLKQSGWEGDASALLQSTTVPTAVFKQVETICDESYKAVIHYLRRLAFPGSLPPYRGALCGYLDFLYPLLKAVKSLPFMPKGPIFLLLDDADNLNLTQTTILNSWVSSRTSAAVSVKISTQLNYKSYRTSIGTTISTPHDYSEVDIATVYTSSREKYKERVTKIVEKRLQLAKIASSPDEFFPPDEEQEKAIAAIANEIRSKFEESGRGFRPSDDVVRYARPNFIRQLRGQRKSGHTYSYAGFSQLVHVSDGSIRYFLEPASLMFSEEQSLAPDKPIAQIRPGIQHAIVHKQAELLMFNEFEKLKSEPKLDSSHLKRVQKLGNLIHALGGTFRAILLSDRSERKVFSIAFSDAPDDEVLSVLRLGTEYGYFHESTIGNKEGTGRTRLYVLTRRLAPLFTLDVTGFAGYLFVTNMSIKMAMHTPSAMLRKLETASIDDFFSDQQLNLFAENQ